MTESKRARTTTSGQTSAPAMAESVEPASSSDVARSTETEGSATTAGADAPTGNGGRARTPLSLTIRLPFFTATLGQQPAAAAPAAATPAAERNPGGTLEKVAFYGGVATMGALGALEWPVVFAVAAGTWVAQHTPPVAGTARRIASRQPAGTTESATREAAVTTVGV